jgi:arsenate reductase
MAEGFARYFHPQTIEPHSAGTSPGTLDPRAVEVMREAGLDLAGQRSKGIEALRELDFDWIVTVCDHATEACPAFPRAVRKLHASFDDPVKLAAGTGGEAALAPYRRVRNEIRDFIRELPARLAADMPEPAVAGDLAPVVALVAAAGLPTAGIEDAFPAGYSVVRRGAEIVAVAGLEPHGGAGLLRSVAV